MILTISKKLILSFLGLTVVVLIATLGLARWSFERGFLDYINTLEQLRLQRLAVGLSKEYLAANGSWSELTPLQFDRLLHSGPESERPGRPPPPRPRPPASQSSVSNIELAEPLSDLQRQSEPPFHPPPGRPPPPKKPERGPPTALFDTDNQFIAGMRIFEISNPISIPVMVDGEKVGELRSAPRRYFDSPQEAAFSKQQMMTSTLIGIGALALAAVVAWLITQVLLVPIRRMAADVSSLSNGDYSARLNDSSQDELGQLMRDLDRLAYTLEENRASRRRWLADISHELRTPVAVLTCQIEALKDGIRPLEMQQIFSLDQEISRLRHFIDDLYELSLADIGGLRYSFGPVNLKEIMTIMVEGICKRAIEKNIELNFLSASDEIINADGQRLAQLFNNLLENALAYTDAPGRIDINLFRTENQVCIKIQDTPPSVAVSECGKLFDPLYRQETSRSRRSAGAGLGLAICKNIVDAHQGTIKAFPSALGGLCMHISFPILTGKYYGQ